MSTGTKPAMILPEPAHNYADVRVPNPFHYGDEIRPVAEHRYSYDAKRTACTRHLFDALETLNVSYDDNEDEILAFRVVMTCVICGQVESWTGTRKANDDKQAHIDPTPLSYKGLRAQQINADSTYHMDMSSYAIFNGTAQIGTIGWSRGPRGRAYFQGRLNTWPEGQSVEGKTPMAALKNVWTNSDAGRTAAAQTKLEANR